MNFPSIRETLKEYPKSADVFLYEFGGRVHFPLTKQVLGSAINYDRLILQEKKSIKRRFRQFANYSSAILAIPYSVFFDLLIEEPVVYMNKLCGKIQRSKLFH